MSSTTSSSASLQTYINHAAGQSRFDHDFVAACASAFQTCPLQPLLLKNRKNRIIYHIGSFNPPHLGHLALIEHTINNVITQTSETDLHEDSLHAVALVVIAHDEEWIARKAMKASKALAKAAIGPKSKAKPISNSRGEDTVLHLKFKHRWQLLHDGIPEKLMKKGIWLFPGGPNDWWVFQDSLIRYCERDGFQVEFVELLGPDYVTVEKPRCGGEHGVVTSNICRVPDFLIQDDTGRLQALNAFDDWISLGGERLLGVIPEDSPETRDRVYVCKKGRHESYRIWFIRSDKTVLNTDMSSTQLRRIIASSAPADLLQKIRGYAMSPDLLARFLTSKDYRR